MVFVDLRPLKFRNFRFLFFSQLVSMLGSQMTLVTLPFQIYSLTHSTFQTGLVSAIELVCLLCTALWGGAIADKFDRRAIIVRSELLMMVLVLILAINAWLPEPYLWPIYVLAGAISAINGFHRPAFEALTPLMVPKSEVSKISSLMSIKFLSASLVGPTLAGLLASSVGPLLTYLIDASSFVLSIILLLQITISFQPTKEQQSQSGSLITQIIDGGRYLLTRKDILASYLIDFFAMVFCMPQVLFPAFAEYYNKSKWLGSLYTSIALGGLLASLLSRWTTNVKRLGIGIAVAASGWSLSILSAGLSRTFVMVLVGLFFAGICDSYSGIFRMTMWNESLSDHYRGRVAGFAMLSFTSGPLLGNTVMGFLGDLVGLHTALTIGASVSLMAISISLFCWPTFWRYRSPVHDENEITR